MDWFLFDIGRRRERVNFLLMQQYLVRELSFLS